MPPAPTTRITLAALLTISIGAGCYDAAPTSLPPPPPPDPDRVLLRDVTIEHLPNPFYHFEYDQAGHIAFVSYASELTRYDVKYAGGRISELGNNILVNHDRLLYTYDDSGRVAEVREMDSTGVVFLTVFLTYQGPRLTALERDRRVTGGFIIDKTMAFSYDAAGNVRDIVDHRPPIDGLQDEATFVDRLEDYDAGINVDGFSLIHNDFFDHLVLLDGVPFQHGNPRRRSRTENGRPLFVVAYAYTYDTKNRPVARHGEVTFINPAGDTTHTVSNAAYTYY